MNFRDVVRVRACVRAWVRASWIISRTVLHYTDSYQSKLRSARGNVRT